MTDPTDHTDPDSRRVNERVGCVLELKYRSAGHLLVSYCTNLSRGGLFVPTSEPLPMGESVTLDLVLPNDPEPKTLTAVVRWVRVQPSDDGPAGMGLSFEGAESLLGDRIDDIVADLKPLTIEIVGDDTHAWQHVAALARSLVTCETRHHAVEAVFAPDLASSDLVIVDMEAQPGAAMDLLKALGAMEDGPPTLALVASSNVKLRQAAEAVAQVVPVPIDSNDLQARLLQRLAHVETRPSS